METSRESEDSQVTKEERRKAIIEEVKCRAENMDVDVIFLGNPGEEHHFADAIVGVVDEPRGAIIYQAEKVVEAFMEMNGWDYEEALEWYGYNTVRAMDYIKEEDGRPILVDGIEV